MKKIVITLLLALILSSQIGDTEVYAQEKRNYGEEISAYVKEYEDGLVSMETAVFCKNEILYRGYYGYANIENNFSADNTTVYEWGSCSKLLVWISVMQLWEQGKLNFETDIREYLPKNFLTKIQYHEEKITMINLMNHDAGFQESFYENQLADENELFDNLEEAVKVCECYQAYHVGEHTAYSNWSTALAAYIVEQISKENYIDYVHEHIFTPLKMEHTSIDPHMNDNAYVKQKRNELNCYYRGMERKDDENYGVCNTWVQLFPAGSAIGTLEDFAKFGIAFVADDCPLFKSKETREEMFQVTSHYGKTDIAKNCHGLWTSEYSVQTLGHAGNTSGCSANFVFDPISKTGVVIMTNEPGETKFNYGIPNLIFGSVYDRPEINNAKITEKQDISGLYLPTRTMTCGGGTIMKYTGGLFPWKYVSEGKYVMKLAGQDGPTLIQIANCMYVMENNGMSIFLYRSKDRNGNTQLEMFSTDYILEQNGYLKTGIAYGTLLSGLLCIIAIIVKFIIWIVRMIRKSDQKLSVFEKRIFISQVIYGMMSIEILGFMGLYNLSNCNLLSVFSAVMANAFAIIQIDNVRVMLYNFLHSKKDKWIVKMNRVFWITFTAFCVVFIVMFQCYNFWNM